MKKLIALLLCFSLVFAFAACKNRVDEPQTTQEATTKERQTGAPGDWVTNAKGEVQTVTNSYVVPDENSHPVTQIVTDEDGSTRSEMVTTIIYDIETYPGATQVPTVAPGYTNPSNNEKWPGYAFMSKVPVLSNKVDDVSYSKTDKGEIVALRFNEVSYGDYLKYIEKCRAAGFKQDYGTKFPDKEIDGEVYIFYSLSYGLYFGVTYNTDSISYRDCDVKITVSNYDVSGIMSGN